jgi:hypothetical protein
MPANTGKLRWDEQCHRIGLTEESEEAGVAPVVAQSEINRHQPNN